MEPGEPKLDSDSATLCVHVCVCVVCGCVWGEVCACVCMHVCVCVCVGGRGGGRERDACVYYW